MKFGKLNLFPLHLAYAAWRDYYVDRDLNVYSTKRDPCRLNPKKLLGSNSAGWSHSRTFTLNNYSVTHDRIKSLARNHKEFMNETSDKTDILFGLSKIDVDEPVKATVKDRSHATTTRSGLSSKGWIIGSVAVHDGVEHLMFGSKPKIHLTQESVKAEMERLALSKPGQTFVSFKVDKQVTAGAVTWS